MISSPQAPVHVLSYSKKKKITSFSDLKDSEIEFVGKYMAGVSKVAKLLELEEPGYSIVFNHGKDGQQTVDYIHAHIIGGRSLTWPPG